MTQHPWGASTPEINATVIETGSTGATWAAASAAWLGLANATLATAAVVGGQMMASVASISGLRSMTQEAATPPFLAWLGTMAGIALKQAAITASVAEMYTVTRGSMIPSMQSVNNRVREAAAEASNFFGQNTPLIVALNAEYASYTVQNATLGTTYGSAITAATVPVPIPPPPPLSSAAKTIGDAASAMGQAGQLASQAGSGGLGQAASQSASQVSQGGGAASQTTGAMGQMGQLFSAPMQALQSMGSGGGMSNPLQSLQQLLSAPMSMFGQSSGLEQLINGGSTGDAFAPMLAGAGGGGLPLGSAGLGAAGLGGGGGLGAGGGGIGAGGGGLGGVGGLSALAARPESSVAVSRTPILSGVTSPGVVGERVTATAGPGGGVPMAPGAAGSGAGERARRESVAVTAYMPVSDLPEVRREASPSERKLFD